MRQRILLVKLLLAFVDIPAFARLFKYLFQPVDNPLLREIPVEGIGGCRHRKGCPGIDIFLVRAEVGGGLLFGHHARIDSQRHSVAMPVHIRLVQLDDTKTRPV